MTGALADKPALRRALRARRRAFVAGIDRRAQEAAIAARVLARIGTARIIAAYSAIGGEVDVLPILRAAAARGLVTALPHITAGAAAMRFLAWRPGEPLAAGPHGLVQPPADAPEVRPDLIVTPLVGFDRRLNRLGQGAGWYDRAFAALPDARRIGIAWSVQEEAELPVDPWDAPLHGIATEMEWIEPR